MSVHYKFKSTLDYDTVSFDGLHISVADLKKAIFHQKRIGKNTDFDLQITNAQTKEDYTDDNALIAKNTSLIIARVPLTVQQKRSWDRNETQSFANSKDESSGGHPVDLTRLDGSEDDKIRAMMTQSTQDYDPSNYMKIRGANQTGDVPPNYRCYKCYQPGHWIKNCPLGSNQEPIEIKKSTGIPRSFMVPVESPLVPGAMMTPTGHYAVPAIDHQAYKEGKKERPPFSHDPEPAPEKPEIPEDLLCNICKDLLTDTVMIPCCGNSFCDECIRSFLLESEEHECPDCSEKDVSPETLIPNRFLRNAVMNFKNETGYAKRQIYRPALQKLKPIVVEKEIEPSLSEAIQEAKEIFPIPEPESEPKLLPIITSILAVPDELKDEVEPITKPILKTSTEEEHEVIIPLPPGTEPLLPIPSVKTSPEKEIEQSESQTNRKNDREDDYGDYRRLRDRRRSFSKDSQRERTGDGGRRMESFRPMNRKRSLSPRQPQRGDYPVHGTGLPNMINQSKAYLNMPPGNSQRYPPTMHYDSDIHRSAEDRPGTPTVDEPHLHSQTHGNQAPLLPYPPGEDRLPPPPAPNYNQPPPTMAPLNPPLLPDPYMTHTHRMPMYPHQQGPHYGPPRYDRPPYQQSGYRPSQPPRSYNGPPRSMRGMHHLGYRGIQPPPPGLSRNIHNGNPPGVIDDPLEAFERMLREKDERDRRLGKHRRRSRTRSRSRSYTRSRSRSFGRRSPPPRITRSRSPPPKRRTSRSPMPLRRSRTPKRRSRSGSFSISRSRSYSRSQSPRGSMSRDRERDRERDRDRDLPARYRSPVRSPPRFQREQRERERDRPKSREPREGYNTYYNDSSLKEFGFRDRERERDGSNRERPGSRYQSRNQSSQHSIPSLMSHPPPPLMSLGAASQPLERKDYYDSYNRYSGSSAPQQRFSSPSRDSHHKRFDDVAPPGTEGYYDLPPPGVDHPERSTRDDRDRPRITKDQEDRDHKETDDDRLPREERVRERDTRERDDRDRRDRERDRERDDRPIPKEKDDRERREIKDKEHDRHIRRDDDRQTDKRDYEKEKDRYRDDRDRDRHRIDDKIRGRERVDRKDRDFEEKERERHDRHSADRKKTKKSSSPHPTKVRSEIPRDISPEKKKEKKIRDKKKKKDTAEEKLEKKKKKKKEKKSLKEAIAKMESAKLSTQSIEKQLSPVDEKIIRTAPISDMKSEERIHVGRVTIHQDGPMEENDSATIDDEKEFSDNTMIKMMMINPEPPEKSEIIDDSINSNAELGLNPPNPNFKPIPEAKLEEKEIASLYSGLDDTEINAEITENYSLLSDSKLDIDKSINETSGDSMVEESKNIIEITNTTPPRTSTTTEKSPKDEFLAPLPELSKWERDERDEPDEPEDDDTTITDKLDISSSPPRSDTPDEFKSTKVVTSEVLKRAENAIFQKAINAIRPIEIKKISESRKILYQNPEPKTTIELNPESNRTSERKSVNVTINVGRNERNVEITEPTKKSKIDRSKFTAANESPHSPTRLSVKERLGEKVEDVKDDENASYFEREKELNKSDNNMRVRSRSPKASRKISPNTEVRRVESHLSSINTNPERKVFLEDKKREKIDRSREQRSHQLSERYESRDALLKHERIEGRDDGRAGRNEYRSERLEKDRHVRIPIQMKQNLQKNRLVEEELDKKKEKRSREEKKRKKEHRSTSRSKSKDCKRKKEKKHKDKKQKHKEQQSAREKTQEVEKKISNEPQIPPAQQPLEDGTVKKLKKNPRLSSDRKRSALDEASFEPDYSATDSNSDRDEKPTIIDSSDPTVQAKRPKLDETQIEPEKETEVKVVKKRVRSTSSDDDSSTTLSSSSESDDSTFRKRKKKHKKHKKRKSTRKESSSDSDSYSDSSDSSSDEEKHKKKSKKSKSKSKQSKKKKKSKHK